MVSVDWAVVRTCHQASRLLEVVAQERPVDLRGQAVWWPRRPVTLYWEDQGDKYTCPVVEYHRVSIAVTSASPFRVRSPPGVINSA